MYCCKVGLTAILELLRKRAISVDRNWCEDTQTCSYDPNNIKRTTHDLCFEGPSEHHQHKVDTQTRHTNCTHAQIMHTCLHTDETCISCMRTIDTRMAYCIPSQSSSKMTT